MAKKTNAQIRRMVKRAAARGEEYVPPAPEEADETDDERIGTGAKSTETRKLAIAKRLQKELKDIDSKEDMKSKERRSAKRKAEAIAAEEAEIPAAELLELLESQKSEPATAEAHQRTTSTADLNQSEDTHGQKKRNPYILFIGQLNYSTSRDALFGHIQRELGQEYSIADDTVQIRLLTDSKTKKSRGMAFVETSDPELLYALLKLHHTQLDGRRINVERTAGGKRNSEARKSKLTQLRAEQLNHMSEVVDKLLADNLSSGELQEKELDDGVIALCKRHSAATVEASLLEYMETNGRDKDNPSAYLTHIIGKIADEGIEEQKVKREIRERRASERKNSHGGRPPKRARGPGVKTTEIGVLGSKLEDSSELSKAGVDMKMSIVTSPGDKLSTIFPSLTRGRGRGRGYM